MPEVGTVEPEDTEGIFQQVWDPVHSFSSDPVDPAANVDALLAEFAGVVSRDKVKFDALAKRPVGTCVTLAKLLKGTAA